MRLFNVQRYPLYSMLRASSVVPQVPLLLGAQASSIDHLQKARQRSGPVLRHELLCTTEPLYPADGRLALERSVDFWSPKTTFVYVDASHCCTISRNALHVPQVPLLLGAQASSIDDFQKVRQRSGAVLRHELLCATEPLYPADGRLALERSVDFWRPRTTFFYVHASP
eukprot:1179861-Prorocentrum_minimum.AAC.3